MRGQHNRRPVELSIFMAFSLLGALIPIHVLTKGPFTQAIFVAPKLHQVSDMFETPAISRRQIAPGLHVRF